MIRLHRGGLNQSPEMNRSFEQIKLPQFHQEAIELAEMKARGQSCGLRMHAFVYIGSQGFFQNHTTYSMRLHSC